MARKKHPTFIKGAFTHRRTESDYMGVLLDAVTLDDWREVVTSTVAAAKSGDPSARLFLAQYLVGKPDMKAPAPVTVVVQQLSGRDPLVDRLAHRHIESIQFPSIHDDDDWKDAMKARVADELRALEAHEQHTLKIGADADGARLAAGKHAS